MSDVCAAALRAFYNAPQTRTLACMETGAVIALGILALAAAAYLFWHRSRARLYFPGGTVPLDPKEIYEFVYIASFPTQQAAESCKDHTKALDLTPKIFPPSQYQRTWSLHWVLVSKPSGRKIRALESQVKSAVAECGGRYSELAVSKPGATMAADAG